MTTKDQRFVSVLYYKHLDYVQNHFNKLIDITTITSFMSIEQKEKHLLYYTEQALKIDNHNTELNLIKSLLTFSK